MSEEPVGIIASVVADCRDPAALAGFWQALVGGEIVPFPDLGVVTLRAPGFTVDFVENDDAKVGKNRWHLDLSGPDPEAVIERALALGATKADDVGVSDRFQVLRDPEGNEFCVLTHSSVTTPWQPLAP